MSLYESPHYVPGHPDQAWSLPRYPRATVLSASAHPRWALSRQHQRWASPGTTSVETVKVASIHLSISSRTGLPCTVRTPSLLVCSCCVKITPWQRSNTSHCQQQVVRCQSFPDINVVTGLCDRTPIDDTFTLAEYGMKDFIHECHVRKKQHQQCLTNTQYESLPHATMVGSKGCVKLPINTSAPCSRPHFSLVQLTKAPGYLCLCTDEVRSIVTVDLGRESASKLLRTSMWMARDLKHVYIQPHLLTCPRLTLTCIGPNRSVPVTSKGVPPAKRLSGGRSAIRWSSGAA